MSKIIEKDEFIRVIDSPLGDVEDSIRGSNLYLIIYRLTKEYGPINNIQVRCNFEKIYESNLLADKELDYGLKQYLWEFGVMFTDDTLSNVNTSSEKQLLVVIPKWEGLTKLTDYINECRSHGILQMSPNCLFIEDILTNSDFDSINKVLEDSMYANVSLWYLRKNYDYYADLSDRDNAYSSMYSSEEIIDITEELTNMIDVAEIPHNLVDRLIAYGHDLIKSGFKCLTFNNILYKTKFRREMDYFELVSAFLVYMAETYNVHLNATCDETITKMYNIYRNSSFALAEDLIEKRLNGYNPIMRFVSNSGSRFVYIRKIEHRYTYYYFRESEIESLLSGDTNVNIHTWSPNIRSELSERNIVKRDNISKSEFLDELNDDETDRTGSPKIVRLFEVFPDINKIEDIVKVINKYNIKHSKHLPSKYVTVRDLLCRERVEGGVTYKEIGYIESIDEHSYDRRISENIFISNIVDTSDDLYSAHYFPMTRDLNSNLYNLRYVYDIMSNAPKNFINEIIDTNSIYTDVFNDYEILEDGSVDRSFSIAEKFLYYVISKNLSNDGYNRLKNSLTGEYAEYLPSLFKCVFTVSEVLPEFMKYFELYDLIDSDLIDFCGDISDEYIKSVTSGVGGEFDLKNKLFGIMKLEG